MHFLQKCSLWFDVKEGNNKRKNETYIEQRKCFFGRGPKDPGKQKPFKEFNLQKSLKLKNNFFKKRFTEIKERVEM